MQGRIVAEQLVVVGGDRFDGTHTVGRKGDFAGCFVVGIFAEGLLCVIVQGGLIAFRKFGVWLAVFTLRLLVEPTEHFAVNPVGRPVRGLIGTVSPDSTDGHTADGLPGRLTGHDVGFGKQHLAVFINKLRRDGRALVINFFAEVTEQDERADRNQTEHNPHSFEFFHIFTSC